MIRKNDFTRSVLRCCFFVWWDLYAIHTCAVWSFNKQQPSPVFFYVVLNLTREHEAVIVFPLPKLAAAYFAIRSCSPKPNPQNSFQVQNHSKIINAPIIGFCETANSKTIHCLIACKLMKMKKENDWRREAEMRWFSTSSFCFQLLLIDKNFVVDFFFLGLDEAKIEIYAESLIYFLKFEPRLWIGGGGGEWFFWLLHRSFHLAEM